MILLSACAAATEEPPAPTATPIEDGDTIVLGDISDDPGEVIEGTQPLADYMAARLGEYGITSGAVKVATSADEMASLLGQGEVDLYFDSVYPAMLISDESGGQPILRRWRYGVEEYHTLIFASKESGIDSLEDLEGHMVAFDNPFSTSGYLLPAAYLTNEGLNLVGKQSYNAPVDDDQIGFVYSYDDENTLQWVLSGAVSAGATDNVNWDLFFPEEAKEQLLILAETESVPRQVVVVRPGMDDDLQAAIVDILLNVGEDEEGQAALEAFSDTSQFDTFPEGIDEALAWMRDLAADVEDIPQP